MPSKAMAVPDIDPSLAVLVGVTFLVAGIVKGIVGFGLPTVALALLAATVGLKPAIALTVFPALLTNIWQGLAGGHLVLLLKRLAPMLVMIVAGVFLGTMLLVQADAKVLTIFLGCLVIVYALTGLMRLQIPKAGRSEVWMSPVLGVVNGTVTGITGTFIVPGLLYLQALDLPRVQLVQAMGITFSLSSAVMALSLSRVSLLPADLAIISIAATVPAFVGMWLGQWLSSRLTDMQFNNAFFVGLLLVGCVLIARNSGVLD